MLIGVIYYNDTLEDHFRLKLVLKVRMRKVWLSSNLVDVLKLLKIFQKLDNGLPSCLQTA